MDATTFAQFLLRVIHILAGITWIGMLYFFNLVNVNFMKALDAPTKGKVVPELMPRALFWFRWGAVVTWLAGFVYFVWIFVVESQRHVGLALWLGLWLVTWGIIYALLQNVAWWPAGKGIVLGVVVGALVLIMSIVLIK